MSHRRLVAISVLGRVRGWLRGGRTQNWPSVRPTRAAAIARSLAIRRLSAGLPLRVAAAAVVLTCLLSLDAAVAPSGVGARVPNDVGPYRATTGAPLADLPPLASATVPAKPQPAAGPAAQHGAAFAPQAHALPRKEPSPAAAEPLSPAVPVRPTPSVYWGVSMEGVPWDMSKLLDWEQSVAGKRVSIIHYWQFWLQDPAQGLQPFAAGPLDSVRAHGAIPMITWAPERMGGGTNQPDFRLDNIVSGQYDAYIRAWAEGAKAWRHPFFLRWGHEMNGNWFPWSEDTNGNRRGEFVQAWRHIHDIFSQAGVKNVSWVWCPNVDRPESTYPSFTSLYPGDGYVDWTCLDGYNAGPGSDGWGSFVQVYGYAYAQVQQVARSKPLMIGEWGSAEASAGRAPAGSSKEQWIRDALRDEIGRIFPAIRARVWYNWQFDGVDWRIESSKASASAWRVAIASPIYLANHFGKLQASPIPAP